MSSKSFRILFLLSLLVGPLFAYAQTEKPQLAKPQFKKPDWAFSTGAFFNSRSFRRGALLHDNPIFFPLFSIKYKDWLSLGRGGITFSLAKDWWKFNFIPFSYFDAQIPIFDEDQDEFRKARVISIESQLGLEIKLKSRTKLEFKYSKEIKNHQGNFFEASLNVTPLKSFPLLRLGGGLGIGDQKHNRYFYGSQGESGVAFYDFKIQLLLPFLPYKGFGFLNYNFTEIAQDENREGPFTRRNDPKDAISLLMIWKLN